MKLLTLNTHSWQEEDQLNKMEQLAQAIIEQDFDVIALQEVNQHQDSPKVSQKIPSNYPIKEDNFAYLLHQHLLKSNKHYGLCWDHVHQSYGVYQEGLAFLTKSPILEHECIDLIHPYDEKFWKSRRAVRIQIKYNEQRVDLFNCHCGWWDDEESSFQQQMHYIQQKIPSHLTLLLGDFNNPAHIKAQGYEYLLQQGFFDCFNLALDKDEGFTVEKEIDGWRTNTKKLRIDLILSNQKIKVESSHVIFNDKNYGIISDHFGVTTKIKIPKIATK